MNMTSWKLDRILLGQLPSPHLLDHILHIYDSLISYPNDSEPTSRNCMVLFQGKTLFPVLPREDYPVVCVLRAGGWPGSSCLQGEEKKCRAVAWKRDPRGKCRQSWGLKRRWWIAARCWYSTCWHVQVQLMVIQEFKSEAGLQFFILT